MQQLESPARGGQSISIVVGLCKSVGCLLACLLSARGAVYWSRGGGGAAIVPGGNGAFFKSACGCFVCGSGKRANRLPAKPVVVRVCMNVFAVLSALSADSTLSFVLAPPFP